MLWKVNYQFALINHHTSNFCSENFQTLSFTNIKKSQACDSIAILKIFSEVQNHREFFLIHIIRLDDRMIFIRETEIIAFKHARVIVGDEIFNVVSKKIKIIFNAFKFKNSK